MVRPLFIASLGNPPPYARTRHSAGHVLLEALRPLLSQAQDDELPHALFKSPASMNISGKPVQRAFTTFLSRLPPSSRSLARLVILHDELELPPGKLKLKLGGSARGHNGLKSVALSLHGMKTQEQDFARIGVGIGRPVSRESGEVARYVLAKMSSEEESKVRGAAGEALRLLWKVALEGVDRG